MKENTANQYFETITAEQLNPQLTRKLPLEFLKDQCAIPIVLADGQIAVAMAEPLNIEAYDAFVKGWDHLHRQTPDELNQAISFFKEAIELDPKYNRAHAALAWTNLSVSLRFEAKALLNRNDLAKLMARKHLELAMHNPTSTAHLVASKMALFRRQYDDSVTHAKLALAFDTNDPDANLNMAEVLMATGKPKEGLEYVNKTIQLDPRNMAAPLSGAGMAYFIMGDQQKAAKVTERAINHNPTVLSRYSEGLMRMASCRTWAIRLTYNTEPPLSKKDRAA